MIDPLFSTAISAALFATATIPVLLSRRDRRRRFVRPRNIVGDDTVRAMIRYGKAYAVDTGDATMVVVVLDKREADDINVVDLGVEAPIAVKVENKAEAFA